MLECVLSVRNPECLGFITMNIFGLLSLEVTARQARLTRVPQALIVGVGILVTTLFVATTLLVVTSTPVQGQAADPAATTASLTRGSVTITEGYTATIRIRLTGDLSGLNGIDNPFNLSSGPSGNAPLAVEGTDYRLTPIIINIARREATFQIFAIEHPGYDPGLRAMLTLESNSDAIQIGSNGEMRLSIRESTPRPLVSFTADTPFQIDSDGYNYLELIEGEFSTFNIELERQFSRDIRVSVFLSGFTPTVSTPGLVAIPVYQDGIVEHPNRGWRADNYRSRLGQLTIPAGSSGITFTIDTRAIDNDLYESLDSRSLGSIYFRIEGSLALANPVSSRLGLRYIEDDTPTVSFGNSLLGINRSPGPEITSREGERFDVWIALENRIKGNFKVEATLTATVVNGDALRFRIPTVEIASGELGATVTVTVLEDGRINNEQRTVALAVERAVLRPTDGNGRPGRALGVPSNRMTVKVRDNEPIRATLSRSELTLQEGQTATITVDLSGDISSLIDGEATLEIETRPVRGVERGTIYYPRPLYTHLEGGVYTVESVSDIYKTAERNDYELTPITINALTRQAEFEIRAVDDSDYDPLESIVLELVSRSDDVRVVSANSLKLKIDNTAQRPFVSFISMLEKSEYRGEHNRPIQLIREGNTEPFRVVLDRKSNRDIKLTVYAEKRTNIHFEENGTAIPQFVTNYGHEWLNGQGFRPGSSLSTFEIEIPAGELGLTLTVSTLPVDNGLYDYIQEQYVARVLVYIDDDNFRYAHTNFAEGIYNFRILQDEPVPELSFQSPISDDDGNATITVREGESFDIWVNVNPQIGRSTLIRSKIELESELIATTVTGDASDLELPDLKILSEQPGVTVTVRIPDDSLANGQRTVVLDFEDAKVVQPERRKINEIAARVGNSLIVNILDDESPVASLSTPTLTLNEGQTGTIKVNLRGDISSLTDSNTPLRLEPLPGGTINVASYYELPSTISVNQAGYEASFEVRALEDTTYSGNKSVSFRLVSSSDDIPVEGLDELTLNIIDNDFPRAEFGTTTLTLTEGQTATVQIELSGAIGPLHGNNPTLTLSSRPASVVEYGLLERRIYDEALDGTRIEEVPVPYKTATSDTDYILTNPISIDWATRMATFEILAREDGEYDPYENIVFELTSPLAGFVSTQLKLEIVNEDPKPSLSFTSREGLGSVADNPGLLVDEGGQSQFEIVLEHKSNRDVEIGLFLVSSLPDDYDRDIDDLVYTDGGQVAPIPVYAGWGSYIVDHGWANGSEIPEARRLRIPAGELGISLTLDTRLIYEEIFKEIQPGLIGTALFYTDGLAAVASSQNGPDRLLLAFWEERPTLTLAFEDGRSTATVQEGDSFDVRVSLSNSIARRYRIIEAGWTATLVNGPELSWNLPTLQTTYDGAELTIDQPESERNVAGFTITGFTVTLTVPEDYSASGDRTVRLGLLDAQVREWVVITPHGSTDLEVENYLTLTVRDDDVPSVSLSRDSLTVPEGRTVTVQVELSGDIESAIGSTLTLVPQLGVSAEPTDYSQNQVVIDEQIARDARATFVIHAVHDQTSEQLESVTFKLEDPSGATRDGTQTELVLNIVDYATPHISLGNGSLTLPEGQRMEIPIEFGGDLSSLLADTPTLRIEQRAGGTPGYGGYEWALTPITVVDGVARATLELTAATDDDYDPDESYVLELVSSSPDLVPVEPNLLTLRITNDDQLPRVAFKPLGGGPFISVTEGQIAQFKVMLDRRTTQDVELGVFLDNSNTDNYGSFDHNRINELVFLGEELTTPLPIYRGGAARINYIAGQGLLAGAETPMAQRLIIPAGERSLTLTFDGSKLDDDFSEIFALKIFGYIGLYVFGQAATVWQADSTKPIIYYEDDVPNLALAFDDGSASVTIDEGAEFDVRLSLSNELKVAHRVEIDWTATLVTGPGLSWQPSNLRPTIDGYGVDVTLTAPDDADNNGDRVFTLGLRNAILKDPNNAGVAVRLVATNGLTVTVRDDDQPYVLPGTDYLKIPEGQNVSIQIELGGDIQSALGTTLTLSARPDATATADDYSIRPVVIDEQIVQAARATFEIHAIHDQVREQIENVTFKLESDSGAVQVPAATRLTLDIVDYAMPRAALETNLVTLPEGDSVTIQIILGGDIGSLASNTPTLTLRQLPGGNPGYGGYELTETPITIVDGVAHASLELRADNDADYDPGQSFVLELVSSSDALTFLQPNRLTLEIVNDDSVPSASLRGSNPTGITVISALENSVVQFAINLDRRSIDDLELGVFLDDQGSNYDPLSRSANLDQLVFANPEDPTALPLYTGGGDYIDGQGWSQGAMIPEARLLTIPAGSTTLTFTFDATRLDDDLFKSLALKFLGYIRLYVDGVSVTTDQPDSLAAISSIEDDIPTLDLTFDDGNLTAAVREGDQFDIRVNLSNRIENELYEIIAGLTTTLVTGPDFSWQPPDLQIGTGVSGLTLTLTAPNDDLLSGDRTLLLGLEDVVLGDSALGRLVAYSPRKVTLSVSNGLTLTVYDDDFPRASFSTSMLTLEEGRATTVPIQLDGDLRSLADVTTTLMLVQQPGTTATADDYTPNPPIITIAPGESLATMPISAVDDELYDPGEIVIFKLRSLTDGVFVDPDSVLTLNIVENDPSARLSISALNLREGESAMIAVQLDGDLDLITDDGALQLERQSGTATVEDDYELIAGTIDRATRQALFEIRAAEDTSYDPGEIVTFRLVTSPAEEIELLGSTELILNIVDDFIYASVTTPEVNLEEGHSATVEIQLEGDLTLLLDEHIALTVTPRPGQTAEGEDYELTPITVDEATSRATVGVLALNDDHYDPAETALLEFGPDTARDNIRWVGSNLVTLNIADNGEEPFISFKGVSAEIQTDDPDPYLTVLEGETAHFRAELSRPAEYDIRFMPILSVANEMVAVEGLDAIFTYANASSGYREGEGWSSGSDISEPHSVTIPAGELGVDFSVDTAELDNDSFGFLGTKEITSIYLNVKGSAVRTDRDSSTLTLKYSEDDIPVLSFVDQNFVVTEGDSADISIASRFPLPDGFEIEVTLTTIADATALDLELPTVTIGPSSSPNPVTTFSLETPDDSISNRPGYVIVQMTDAVLKETVWPYRQLPLGVMEELGLDAFDLTIHDNDPATVSLRRADEYLLEPEGDNLTIGLSLRGDVSSIAGVNDILTIEQQSGDAVEGDDYTLTPIVIKESGSGVAYNSFEIYITDDRYYEPRETAAFVLKSTSPDITVVDLKRFWLTIPANDFLRASLSPSELTLMEGGSATVTVQLDGDLSPLIDGRATLALELLSDATLSNDYTLTPITIDTATSVASFEIFATDDSDYDPGEQIRLGLTSPWDRGYISPPRWLTLNIQDNDEQPRASFTSESDFPTDDDGIPYLQVVEGEQAQFKLELNRKTNYDLRFSVFLDSRLDNSRVNINDLVSTAQLDTIPVDDDHQQQYSEGQGWLPGPSYDIPESEWLTIPAGESGIDFTFDTAQLDDDAL